MRQVQKDAIEFLHGTRARAGRTTRWCSTPCSIPWPTCSAPPASSGTPATARNMMREAVSLMGGYGITEDCPGFLGHKWMDAQLEATYEGPEAVQRRQLTVTMTNELFLAQFRDWIREMRADRHRPARHRRLRAGHRHADVAVDARTTCSSATDADGAKLYQSTRQGVTFPLADALCWLLASRCQILDVLELEKTGARRIPVVAEGLPGLLRVPHRPVPRAGGARRRRSGPHLRRAGVRLQPPSRLGHRGLRHLLPGRRPGRAWRA